MIWLGPPLMFGFLQCFGGHARRRYRREWKYRAICCRGGVFGRLCGGDPWETHHTITLKATATNSVNLLVAFFTEGPRQIEIINAARSRDPKHTAFEQPALTKINELGLSDGSLTHTIAGANLATVSA